MMRYESRGSLFISRYNIALEDLEVSAYEACTENVQIWSRQNFCLKREMDSIPPMNIDSNCEIQER